MAAQRTVVREGITAGLIGATAVALWFLAVDTVAGHPFETPRLLGQAFFSVFGQAASPDRAMTQVVGYTAFHYLVFIALGLIVAWFAKAAQKEPNIVAGFVVLFIAFEAGVYGLTALLSQSQLLGRLAWYQVGAANLVAAALMGVYILRGHPELRQELTYALEGRE